MIIINSKVIYRTQDASLHVQSCIPKTTVFQGAARDHLSLPSGSVLLVGGAGLDVS